MILLAMVDIVGAIARSQSHASHLQGGAHRARRLRVKFLAVQEWSDRHRQAYCLAKFDTTGLCCDTFDC